MRRLRGLSDRQTLQRQPTTGTPMLVPVPMMTISPVAARLCEALGSAWDKFRVLLQSGPGQRRVCIPAAGGQTQFKAFAAEDQRAISNSVVPVRGRYLPDSGGLE